MTTETELLEVRLVLEAIYAKYGYDFRGYSADSITRRVRAALARSGLTHLGEFQHQLLIDPEFFNKVLDSLTVQVSSLFRDPEIYVKFRTEVVPLLRTYPRLKIWHAGCASGEEVYTMAILLSEEGLYDRTSLYATDISATAINKAREGSYSAQELPNYCRNYQLAGGKSSLADYYVSAYDGIALHAALRRNVTFFQHDLVTDYGLGEMQVIFCRNVLLYFGSSLRTRVCEMFERNLCHGGLLCLGKNEQLPASHRDNFQEFAANERIYRKMSTA